MNYNRPLIEKITSPAKDSLEVQLDYAGQVLEELDKRIT